MKTIKFATQLGISPEAAMAMFDVILEQQALIEHGERCDRCGKLHLPEDLTQGLCDDCHMALAIEEAEKEFEKEIEEIAELLALISLLSDEYPIDLRMF